MYCRMALWFLLAVGAAINAQMINVRGTVTNSAAAPVSDAIVELSSQELIDTTDEDGVFSITKNIVGTLPYIAARKEGIYLDRGVLELSPRGGSPVCVKIYDMRGRLLKRESVDKAQSSIYRMNIADYANAANLLVVHASINGYEKVFSFMPMHDNRYAVGSSGRAAVTRGRGLLTAAVTPEAVTDSIEVTAEGYVKKTVQITSYDTTLEIVLENQNICEGCGKTDHLQSGYGKLTSDGIERDYYVKIPEDYDPDRSYKLIFCFHWWYGSMDAVISGDIIGGPYYGLEALADNSAIFVAPNGLEDDGGPRGWVNPGGRDIRFIRALLDHLDSNLCIDQQRIFSTGFSYGGMMSFAIGCAMSDIFRAIAPMSGAFYSGCDDSSSTGGGPIAVWMAHGTADETVPIAHGKTALNYFLEKNECSDVTVPVDPSPCVAYQDCATGYPVIFCEFNGPHGPQSFAPQATWDFFSQF